jgi:hypothetical protein
VNKELKEYILSSYENKLDKIEKEKKLAISEATDTHVKTLKLEAESILEPIRIDLKAAAAKLRKIGITPDYYVRELIERRTGYDTPNLPDKIKSKISEPFETKIKALESQRDQLIIRISLEKSFDEINKILKESGQGFPIQ